MRLFPLFAVALLAAVSCKYALPAGVRLLRVEIALGGDVVLDGIWGFPDHKPTGEVWHVIGDIPFEPAEGNASIAKGLKPRALLLEGDVVVRITHVERDLVPPLPLDHLSLEQEESDSSWSITEVDANRILHEIERRRQASPKSDGWGETTTVLAEFYSAVDVSDAQIDLTKEWHGIGEDAWGNYGPVEFWIVGSSKVAAKALDDIYCSLRVEKDHSISLRHCRNRGHNFVSYATEGNAGLNVRRNEREEWSGYIITMSSKHPSPDENDYKSVVLHEYFHVYQQAHIYSKKESERESRNLKNPWWAEGGAEYMAQLLYSQQPGLKPNHLKEKMRWKMESLKDLRAGESIRDIPYGDRAMVAYDLGTWFIAFVISKTSEEAYRVGFFRDLNEKGFEGAFLENFGSSSEDLLEEFHDEFLNLSLDEQSRIIP